MRHRSLCWGIASSVGIIILILDSQTAVSGAREGLSLCMQSLIPSLFPFFILTSLLTNALLGTKIPFLIPFRKLIGIPAGCESILIPATLGGYPAGAQCIGQAYQSGHLSRSTAQKLLLFCNNAGPSFLFGFLGPIFPQKRILWAIWGIQITASIICFRIFSGTIQETASVAKKEPSITASFAVSLRVMASVCGWVILFRVIVAFLQRWFLWQLPTAFRVILIGILEVSNGCYELLLIDDIRLRCMICTAILSFGGLCVTMQTASVIGTLSLYPYIFAKLVQSLFCVLLSILVIYKIVWVIPGIVILFFGMKKIVAFREFLMYNENTNLRRMPYAVSKENRARLCILSARNFAGG